MSDQGSLPTNHSRALRLIIQAHIRYYRSISEAVISGAYDWASKDINDANFPKEAKKPDEDDVIIECIGFDQEVKTEAVLLQFNSDGLRPVTIMELLAIGEHHPEIQRTHQLVSLGSIWERSNGKKYYPYLAGDETRRGIGLYWIGKSWREDGCFIFPAVREYVL
ncbi:hypothetical protein HGA64_02755 [Candidatus Falkowbacteria bacterium]|nr:hypothetical protein [Candidatus Falkowbacteria bacterium]